MTGISTDLTDGLAFFCDQEELGAGPGRDRIIAGRQGSDRERVFKQFLVLFFVAAERRAGGCAAFNQGSVREITVEEEAREFSAGFQEAMHFFHVCWAQRRIESAEKGLFNDQVILALVPEEIALYEPEAGDMAEFVFEPVDEQYKTAGLSQPRTDRRHQCLTLGPGAFPGLTL